MAILVKTLNMPTSCEWCLFADDIPLEKVEGSSGMYYCDYECAVTPSEISGDCEIVTGYVIAGCRPDWCPIIEIQTLEQDDYSFKVWGSLFQSERYKRMNRTAQLLYIAMGLHARGSAEFTFSRSVYRNMLNLSSDGFHKAVNELEQNGFIDVIKRGGASKQRNIYRLSQRWKTDRSR